MKNIIANFFMICPKTKKITGIKLNSKIAKLLFPIISLLALLWVIIRIIPKPSRANYPCMKVAIPISFGFIAYIFGFFISALSFVKAKKSFYESRYIIAILLAFVGIVAVFLISQNSNKFVNAQYTTAYHIANSPIGNAKGIFPGRVVWVHNPDATNENCNPTKFGHGWFMSENNNQAVIDKMLSSALQSISGQTSDSASWNAIFTYYNNTKGKGNIGYAKGEKIFIKTNATSSWTGNFNQSDLSIVYNQNYGISETSPHLVLSVLRQLVNVVGVAQQDIYVGDPLKHIYKHCYDLWHSEFPNVHYLDHDGFAGREKFVKSTTSLIYYSDRGTVLRTGSWDDATVGDPVIQDYLYTIFDDAEYIINIPTLKGHARAGVTMFAKNHFGSHTRDDAKHLHNGLVAPEGTTARRSGYGLYRVQVDLMGHKLLGGKNLMYLMDALWTSDHEVNAPDKWMMAPFNNDWTSSIFLSLDPIAIESVGFDFLRAEFTTERGLGTYPQMPGVDDYLHQCADSSNWPQDIIYDPENDGTHLTSLGVHEHWNNPIDKQYSRNLGTGNGIELIKISSTTSINDESRSNKINGQSILYPNYPNPFSNFTNIRYKLDSPSIVELSIYSINGQLIKTLAREFKRAGNYSALWNGLTEDGNIAPSGIYICKIQILRDRFIIDDSMRMLLMR